MRVMTIRIGICPANNKRKCYFYRAIRQQCFNRFSPEPVQHRVSWLKRCELTNAIRQAAASDKGVIARAGSSDGILILFDRQKYVHLFHHDYHDGFPGTHVTGAYKI